MNSSKKITIVISGPESSGKSTLSADIALHYGVSLAPEYARYYLDKRGPRYNYKDLKVIAQNQQRSINYLKDSNHLTISDTDLLTIKIWSNYKYNRCDPWVVNTLINNKPDLYILCSPDIPWEQDALRENPNDREELFQIYLQEIKKLGVPHIIVKGTRSKREAQAIKAVDKLRTRL